MHEFGIVEEMIEIACERSGGAPIRRIVLEVGELSAVMPDALRFAFELVRESTLAEGAELEIVETEGRARCEGCKGELAVRHPLDRCGCGASELVWIAGTELRIREMEVG